MLSVQGVDQPEHLLRRILAVIVQGDHNVPRYMPVARHQRGVLAEIPAEADTADMGILPAEGLDDLPGFVRRIVVDQDHFIIPSGMGAEDLLDPRCHISHSFGAVVAGNDAADLLHFRFLLGSGDL